jgi:hypothetical protein
VYVLAERKMLRISFRYKSVWFTVCVAMLNVLVLNLNKDRQTVKAVCNDSYDERTNLSLVFKFFFDHVFRWWSMIIMIQCFFLEYFSFLDNYITFIFIPKGTILICVY